MISVLIPVYHGDKADHFSSAINSVINQTYRPSQIVIVVDGPVGVDINGIIDSLEKRDSTIFDIVRLPRNGGLGSALNIGLRHCRNEFIARMDSDDISIPTRFQRQIDYMSRHQNVSIVGSAIEEFVDNPGDLKRYRRLPLAYDNVLRCAKFRSPLNHPTVLFRKSDILKVGSYQEMAYFEDYYLWIRLLVNGFVIENMNECLVHFRVGNDMIGRRQGFKYAKTEFAFLKAAKKIGFLSNLEFVFNLLLRLPIRIVPKSVLKILYSFLR